MIIPEKKLLYFAYPKCASEFIRKKLLLKWNNDYNERDWNMCSIEYCHVKPLKFIIEKNINIDNYTIFTLVRNPYERILSLWNYFYKRSYDYPWIQRTFKGFVTYIYNNRDDLDLLPLSWMFLPVNKYFEGIIDHVRFFKVEELDSCINWLSSNYDIHITNEKINSSDHDHYSKYYDLDTQKMVSKIYKYEIITFKYTFQRSN